VGKSHTEDIGNSTRGDGLASCQSVLMGSAHGNKESGLRFGGDRYCNVSALF